ncbi:membrane protein FxsA [Bacillaceae bacterium]
MLRVLILLLLVVPTLEIWLLVAAGRSLGWMWTLLLVVFTGVTGAYLARRQGLAVWRQAHFQLSQGQIPGEALLDGICILAGGLLLLTPGFFTDTIGFLLLVPFTRAVAKNYMKKWLWKQLQNGNFHFYFRRW